MNQILPWVYIGKFRETLDGSLLRSAGVNALLTFAEPVRHADIVELYLPVEDGVPLSSGVLQQGLNFAMRCQAESGVLMIACGAGISRSATFATALLKEVTQWPLADCLEFLQQKHPEAAPHPALWASLCEHYHEPAALQAIRGAFRHR